MTPDAERWGRIEAAYHEAAARPPAERAACVEALDWLGPDERQEVFELLQNEAAEDGFLDPPIAVTIARDLVAARTDHLVGQRIGPYEVEGLLGVGGMGEVYRARDTRLERAVAIKLVAPHSDTGANDRLIVEARHASRLNHPGICTVHEVGEHGGQPFIVMELVEGDTLSRRLAGGPLADAEVIRIGRAIAAAVAHAHAAGIVHGDLKGPNVMVRPDGQVKVLDFGLARVMRPEAPGSAAVAGATFAGTPACAAPEQLSGQPPDALTDIWSLGVLLYQMTTGRLPFGDAGPGAPADHGAGMPPGTGVDIQVITARCLSPDRAHRYQDVDGLCRDLDACLQRPARAGQKGPRAILASWTPRGGLVVVSLACVVWVTAQLPSPRHGPPHATETVQLAVLPIELLFDAPDQQYLRYAIPDSIIGRLVQSDALRVRPADAVRRAVQSELDVARVARTLRVDHVLRGSLWRTPESYRLALRLVRLPDAVVWADTFDVDADRLFELDGLVARGVLTALGIPPRAEKPRIPRSIEAYRHYLQGRAALTEPTDAAKRLAVSSFETAIRLDREYAPSHAGLAVACARMHYSAAARAESVEWEERSKDAAAEAMRLDDGLAEAHEALAAIHRFNESDWELVVRESRLALALSPGLVLPHQHLTVAYYHMGLFDLAEQSAWAGLEANPNTQALAWLNLGRAQFYAGRYDEAVQNLERAARLDLDAPAWILAEAYRYAGHATQSERMLRNLLVASSEITRQRAAASLAAFRAADAPSRLAASLEELERADVRDHHAAYRIGTAYAQARDVANAHRWLAQAADTGFPCYGWYARDPLLDPVRDSPSFQTLLTNLRQRARAWRAEYTRPLPVATQAPSSRARR